MKYYVTYKIEARFTAEIEADTLEEAIKKAEEEYYNADFGAAEDIDGEPIVITDERDHYIWER